MEDAAATAKLRASLKRIKGKLVDVNQLIAQFSQVKQEKLALQAERAGVQEEVATLRQEKQAFQKRLGALQTALEAQTAGAAMQQQLDAADARNRKQAADLASVQRQNKDLEAAAKKLRLAERERGAASSSTTSSSDDAAAQRLATLLAELQSMKSAKLQAELMRRVAASHHTELLPLTWGLPSGRRRRRLRGSRHGRSRRLSVSSAWALSCSSCAQRSTKRLVKATSWTRHSMPLAL